MTSEPADPFVTELRVRYAETDQMGVVYHTHYLVWCEVARTGLIRALGGSYAQLEKDGTVLAVANANIRYHASARYDDQIAVSVWPLSVQSRAVTFEYRIDRVADAEENHKPIRLATASTMLIALDKTGAPRRLPTHLVEQLRAAIPQ
ncbi:MAG: thioesterase family protein [Longimicrobiales bacterium]